MSISLNPLSWCPCLGATPTRGDAPAEKFEETWPNGIHHVHDGKVDTYDIAGAARPGVPAHITRTRRFLLPARVEATDINGNKLDACMVGLPGQREVWTEDYKSGIQTYLSPKHQDVYAFKPVEKWIKPSPGGYMHHVYNVSEGDQTLNRDGSSIFRGDIRQQIADIPGYAWETCRSYTQVWFPPAGSGRAPSAFYHVQGGDRTDNQARPMTPPDAQGRFAVSNPTDGTHQDFQLFYVPKG